MQTYDFIAGFAGERLHGSDYMPDLCFCRGASNDLSNYFSAELFLQRVSELSLTSHEALEGLLSAD